MKQYAKTINLKDNPELIRKYKEYHANIWPEVESSFKKVGVKNIEIWLLGRRMFMVMTTEDSFDPKTSFEKYLTLSPKNKEWEDLMGTFQERVPEAKPGEHWAEMEKVFEFK